MKLTEHIKIVRELYGLNWVMAFVVALDIRWQRRNTETITHTVTAKSK